MYTISRAAVIGAGTMGLGIAGQLANAGIEVVLLDVPASGTNRNAIGERAIARLLDENQPGLTHKDNLKLITIGNIEDDIGKLADVDWIAEAVVEQLAIKKDLYRRIDAIRKNGSIVSSNTSTIPISLLVEGMPADFRAEFAITHFFNPVRYMRLLELVRGTDTRADVIVCLEQFNDEKMGKGIVICNDTPGFLGNRVGVFAIQAALHAAFRLGLTPEDADAVFGRPMGIPKTGVFGLYDLIGIDLMSDVVKSLVAILPAGDAFHEVASEIPLMTRMIESGNIGNKSAKGGFYRQDVAAYGTRETLDFATFQYRRHDGDKPPLARAAESANDFRLLLDADDELGEFAWYVLSTTLCYAANLVPDVNESLVAIDDAMKLGYNWIQGPFEMIDTIGVDVFVARLESEGRKIPAILQQAAGSTLYRPGRGKLDYLRADGSYTELKRATGVMRFSEERRKLVPEIENAAASYFVLPESIGLVEFHSKANTLNADSMQVLAAAITHAEKNCRGIIVHNDAQHFSCGVNLDDVLNFVQHQDWRGLDAFLERFQQTVLAMKNATIPAVAAPSGLSLGGGFEVVLHADKVVCHANSVMGLVETLVGVVPGGGGVKEMLYRWCDRHDGDTTKAAWDTFMNIGYAKTARSPLEAAPLAMFRKSTDTYIMNRDRLLGFAIDVVTEMAASYEPAPRGTLTMPGAAVYQQMQEWLERAHSKGRLTPHDVTTGSQVAMIVTGGDIDADTKLAESGICDLERNAFLTLAKTAETKARLQHMLAVGKPLRN